MMVDIRLASEVPIIDVVTESSEPKNFVTPGTVITEETGFMRLIYCVVYSLNIN